jgi:CRISPR-associated protein Cmr3
MTSPCIVSLTPRDGLFLKDGRGWFTSESGRAGAVEWPFAGTVRGALRTCLGHAREQTLERPLAADEWLLLNTALGVDAVLPLCRPVGASLTAAARRWPAPRDAVIFTGEDRVRPLLPAATSACGTISLDDSSEAAAIEALMHPSPGDVMGKPAAMPAWWSDEAFTAWLCGMPLSAATVAPAGRPVARVQTHVTIDPTTGAAREGGLFSSTVVEPLTRTAKDGTPHEWAIAAIGSGFEPGSLAGRSVRLGGDGRCVSCAPVSADTFSMPDPRRHGPREFPARVAARLAAGAGSRDRRRHARRGGGGTPCGVRRTPGARLGVGHGRTPPEAYAAARTGRQRLLL